jgi:hypothetical protein
MTFEEETRIAQDVLNRLAAQGPSGDARGARVWLAGIGYNVHRHGNDLRFNQYTDLRSGESGRFLIVSVGEHMGGWIVARSQRPPGLYHDERAAESARKLVEHTLVQLGYDVGTPGTEGHKKTGRELEADIREFLTQSNLPLPPAPRRRAARRPARRTTSR